LGLSRWQIYRGFRHRDERCTTEQRRRAKSKLVAKGEKNAARLEVEEATRSIKKGFRAMWARVPVFGWSRGKFTKTQRILEV